VRQGRYRVHRTVQRVRHLGRLRLNRLIERVEGANTYLPTAEGQRVAIFYLFGIHPGTAHTWAKFAQASWTDYLAAGTTSEPAAVRLNG
jgi:hypothetical protein